MSNDHIDYDFMHLSTLLAAVVVTVYTVYAYTRAKDKEDKVFRQINENIDQIVEKDKRPFLLVIMVKYQMTKHMIRAALIIELLYFLNSNIVIKHQNQYIYHSVLSKGEHCQYYDYLFAFDYYQMAAISTFNQLLLVFCMRGKITRTFVNKLMLAVGLSIVKVLGDGQRLISYEMIRDLQTVQILYDILVLFLLIYLFIYSSKINHLQQFVDNLDEKKWKEVYSQQMDKLENQDDNQIMSYSDTIMKAFNTYHQLKNIRKNSSIEFKQGRNFSVTFISIICLFFFVNNFKEFRTLYTKSQPVFTRFQMKKLENSFGSQQKQFIKEENNHQKQNVIFYIMSGVSYESFEQNVMTEIHNNIQNKDDSKLFKLQSVTASSSIGSWISMFSGSKPEIHGVNGDSTTLDFNRVDNIFKYIDNDDQMEYMIYGNDFFEDVMNQMFENIKLSRYYKENTHQRNILREPNFKNRTKTQKIDRYIQHYEQQNQDHSNVQQKALDELLQFKKQYQKLLEKQNNKETLTEEEQQEYVQIINGLQNVLNEGKKLKSLINKNYFLVFQDDDIYQSNLKPYNNQYQQLHSKGKEIAHIINSLKDETTLIITSDRSQPDSLPFFVYKKGSYIHTDSNNPKAENEQDKSEHSYELTDIASTLSVLVGQPIPKLNQGKFIDHPIIFSPQTDRYLFHQDLFNQQVNLLSILFEKYSLSVETFNQIKDQQQTLLQVSTLYGHITTMCTLFSSQLQQVQVNDQQQTLYMKGLLSLVVQGLLVIMLQCMTFTDCFSLFQGPSLSRSINVGCLKNAIWLYILVMSGPVLEGIGNIIAMDKSLDVSSIDSPLMLNYYLLLAFVKPVACNILLQVSLFYYYAIWSNQEIITDQPFNNYPMKVCQNKCEQTASKYMRYGQLYRVNKNELEYSEYGLGKIYLVRVYLVVISMVVGGMGMSVGGQEMSVPLMNQIRFVVMSVQWVNLCVLGISVYSLYLWPQFSLSKSCFDSIYLLREYKASKHLPCSHITAIFKSHFVRRHTNVDMVDRQDSLGVGVEVEVGGDNKNGSGSGQTSYDEGYRQRLLQVFFGQVKEEHLDVQLKEQANQFSDEYQMVDAGLIQVLYRTNN